MFPANIVEFWFAYLAALPPGQRPPEHTRYFNRRGAQLGLKFSPDLLVFCERFRRVYPP